MTTTAQITASFNLGPYEINLNLTGAGTWEKETFENSFCTYWTFDLDFVDSGFVHILNEAELEVDFHDLESKSPKLFKKIESMLYNGRGFNRFEVE